MKVFSDPGPGGVPPRQPIRLTPREMEVLVLLSEGMANKHIAHTLRITLGTVKVHITRLSNKTGLRNRTRLALFAAALRDREVT